MKDIKRHFPGGFTMLEVVIVIGVIAILSGLIAPLAVNTIKQSRVNACWEEIQLIKKAIVGDPALVQYGSRSSFGFVGDLGVMPANLDELINRDASRPLYGEYLTTRMFFGWRGPYISEAVDPWGRNYRYLLQNATATNKVIAYIWSVGADGQTTADPSTVDPINLDNIRISISQDEAFSMISGNTLDTCGAGTACNPITISTPNGTNAIYTTSPSLSTTAVLPVFNTGYALYQANGSATSIYPIGVRYIVFTTGGVNYAFLITINNGPTTIVNFREPGACPN